jgi:hypothetical protein
VTVLPMSNRCISLVPSKIVKIVDERAVSAGSGPSIPVASARIQHLIPRVATVSGRHAHVAEHGHTRPKRAAWNEPLPDPGGPGVLGRAHPDARQSGPRKGRGKKGHGNTYAKRIAVLAAYAAANTDTFLGERFRRLAFRPGGGGRKKAGCAVGRSILVIVWHLLNDPAARYRDLGSGWHARHTDRSRKARNARRQLEALGYDVIITLREDAA